MSAYREPPARLSIAPRAPWWRILRAWAGGTFSRLAWAQSNRQSLSSLRRSRVSSDQWIPRGYAAALRSVMESIPDPTRPLPKGSQHLPANLPE